MVNDDKNKDEKFEESDFSSFGISKLCMQMEEVAEKDKDSDIRRAAK